MTAWIQSGFLISAIVVVIWLQPSQCVNGGASMLYVKAIDDAEGSNADDMGRHVQKRNLGGHMQYLGLGKRRLDTALRMAGLGKRVDSGLLLAGLGKRMLERNRPILGFEKRSSFDSGMHLTGLGKRNNLNNRLFASREESSEDPNSPSRRNAVSAMRLAGLGKRAAKEDQSMADPGSLNKGLGNSQIQRRSADSAYRHMGLGKRDPGAAFRNMGLGKRDPESAFRHMGLGKRDPDSAFRQMGLGKRDPESAFRHMGLGKRDPDSAFRNMGLGKRDPESAFRHMGLGKRDPDSAFRHMGLGKRDPSTDYSLIFPPLSEESENFSTDNINKKILQELSFLLQKPTPHEQNIRYSNGYKKRFGITARSSHSTLPMDPALVLMGIGK